MMGGGSKAPTTLFVVNRVDELVPGMTTVMLIEAAARRDHAVAVAGVADLSLDRNDRVHAAAHAAPENPAGRDDLAARSAWLARLQSAPPAAIPLDTIDLVMLRTNPAREMARAGIHATALALADVLDRRGSRVVNRPAGLRAAATKLYLERLPAHARPPMLVSADRAAIADYVRAIAGPAVLKPIAGTRGRGVFRVAPGDANLGAIMDLLLAEGYVVAQPYLPEGDAGDVRAIVLRGRLLEVDGHPAAIRRIPSAGDFRGNLHAGGRAEPAPLSDAQRNTIAAVGPILAADGIALAGIDLVGDRVIEVNVHSPGGLRDAEGFAGVDFADAIVAACG